MLHHRIEDVLDASINTLESLHSKLRFNGGITEQDAQTVLLQNEHFKLVQQYMQGLMKDLNQQEFNKFRQYLSSYGKEGDINFLPGPSGAFTASIPIIELLIGGDKSNKEFLKSLEKRTLFYPVVQRDLMLRLLKENSKPSLLTMAKNHLGGEQLYKAVQDVARDLQGFRHSHMGLVKRKLPNEFVGTSGNESPKEFLKKRIDETPLD